MNDPQVHKRRGSRRRSSAHDRSNSYGWISIVMHWVSAAIILSLWFIGDSINAADTSGDRFAQTHLHVSIALCAYPLLWFRIGWRLKQGHPRLDGEGPIDRWLAKINHYVLLAAVALMLLSGPMTVWASGRELAIFDWFRLSSPFGSNSDLHALSLLIHRTSATIIIFATLAHFLGAMKHMMFDDDDVFIRMLAPKKKPTTRE